ncbi:MAG: flagellar protein FliS [Alphaproteobacteria bacterium]|nr:flagellar protein FliS [Alphaproteobacteria bacterium]
MNPYNTYARNQTESRLPGENISALFAKAASHMHEASVAIENMDINQRYESSQKAMVIMEGLLGCLNRDTPERAEAAKTLEAYYKTMIFMISRVNVFNDLETSKSIEQSFRDMAIFWKKATAQLVQQEDETFLPEVNAAGVHA